jgi:hypothetical protein
MIDRMGRRLASALERLGYAPMPSAPVGDSVPTTRTVEFLAYGEDCLLVGRLRLGADRMTDLLNERETFDVLDIVVEQLDDGRSATAPELTVSRDELLLVQVAGPRGDASRRIRTRGYPVAAQVGPYRVRGHLHAMPGVDPTTVIHHRAPMVPLTDAWLDRPLGTERDLQHVGTVVINRDRMDWVVASWEDSSRWLDETD